MAEKEIRLPKWDGKEYYPATTTEAVADRERQKGLNEVLSDIEHTIDSYNRANQIMLNQKQNKLNNYKEDPSNGSVDIYAQDTVSMRNYSQGGVASVEVYNEDIAEGIIPVARMSSEKESGDYAYIETRGNEVNIVGDYVTVNGADLSQAIQDVAALNGTGEGSVSKKVTDEIAKVIANAPADFDTLKEIADYIDSDKTNAAEINNTLAALTTRVYELGDFPTSGDAERKAAEETISKSPSISIIHYTVNGSASHIILQNVNDAFTQQVLYYGGHTYIRHIAPHLNASWMKTNPTNIKYNPDSHRIALMHMVNQYGEGDNNIDWVELPTASTSTDGLMTKAQVESLEGKQDKLQTYTEQPRSHVLITMPSADEDINNASIKVTKTTAAMFSTDNSATVSTGPSGTQLIYSKRDESNNIVHDDRISIGKHNEDNPHTGTHITLTSESATEEDGEKVTQTSSMQVTPEGISMSSPNGEIEDVVKEINEKAPKVGYAPDLKVNFAKELVGRGESTPEVIGGIRPTGVRSIGDGNATIERIKGESVVWNQYASDAITFKKMSTQDNITYVPTTTTPNGNIYYELGVAKGSHKYLCTGNIVNSKGIIPTAGRLPLNTVFSLANATKVRLLPFGSNDTNITTDDWVRIEEPIQFHDLTLMFGAGNEPTTIEDFEARKPLGVSNEYNEGTIVSYNGANELKSVGFNAYNGTYAKVIGGKIYHATGTTSVSFAKELDGDTTPITLSDKGEFTPTEDGYVYAEGKDIVIHLTHSYTPEHVDEYEEDVHPLPNISAIKDANGNQLFPNGLLSAGSVHDEITATKAVKRVGVVDMGTLSWRYTADKYSKFSAKMPNDAVNYSPTIFPNMLNSLYQPQRHDAALLSDKNMWRAAEYIGLYDSSYTSASDFKAAMSGVLLYYELAEPIEVDLPEPLNMTYEAWDFGTEELVAKGATTPLNADIVYQFNAVDRIRENSSAIENLEEHVEERKDDGIELLTNGNLKLTLKGETREFMPATPSGDPMHWAYVSAGAEYNDTGEDIVKTGVFGDTIIHKAGYWYFNEIGDLSTQEIAEIYSQRWMSRSTPPSQYFWGVKSRTVCINLSSSSGLSNYTFYHDYNVEKLKLTREPQNNITLSTSTMASIISLHSLTKILTILKANNTTAFTAWFDGCTALNEVRILGLKCNISFKHCSNISQTSVKYMIENATPTSAITITLHANAYARLAEDADIVAALEAKPLVTLVSA